MTSSWTELRRRNATRVCALSEAIGDRQDGEVALTIHSRGSLYPFSKRDCLESLLGIKVKATTTTTAAAAAAAAAGAAASIVCVFVLLLSSARLREKTSRGTDPGRFSTLDEFLLLPSPESLQFAPGLLLGKRVRICAEFDPMCSFRRFPSHACFPVLPVRSCFSRRTEGHRRMATKILSENPAQLQAVLFVRPSIETARFPSARQTHIRRFGGR